MHYTWFTFTCELCGLRREAMSLPSTAETAACDVGQGNHVENRTLQINVTALNVVLCGVLKNRVAPWKMSLPYNWRVAVSKVNGTFTATRADPGVWTHDSTQSKIPIVNLRMHQSWVLTRLYIALWLAIMASGQGLLPRLKTPFNN